MEFNPYIALLQAATSNNKCQHTARGRRRAMERALNKLSKMGNKPKDSSLEEHDE